MAMVWFPTPVRRTIGTRSSLLSGVVSPTQVLQNVYAVEDVNLDGKVKYAGAENDRDPILLTIGGSTPTNVRHEQLP
jgi:hypothetical protein